MPAPMTWERWTRLSEREREAYRNTSALHPVLKDLRGYRVEVLYYGERKRFIVGQTTGWKPATLGLKTRRSMGSSDLLTVENCQLVRVIEKVR